ncbi:hypothetical protein [Streptomyces sp. NPDC018972]|uniref:hypothetical protein n=1 Tax=Streptomyces sp. NPDC018972 TaxID=3365060 RepID=UPI0037B6C744
MTELGIVTVRVEQGIGPIRPGQLCVGDRAGQPPDSQGWRASPSTRRITATGTR